MEWRDGRSYSDDDSSRFSFNVVEILDLDKGFCDLKQFENARGVPMIGLISLGQSRHVLKKIKIILKLRLAKSPFTWAGG